MSQQLADNPEASMPTAGQIKNARILHEERQKMAWQDYTIPTVRLKHPETGHEVVINDPDGSHPVAKEHGAGEEFKRWRDQGYERVGPGRKQAQMEESPIVVDEKAKRAKKSE